MTKLHAEESDLGARRVLVLATSSAPFSMSEIWFQSEVEEVDKTCDVLFAPVWPRGKKQDWRGHLLRANGRPSLRPFGTMRALATSRELRKMLWSCRSTVNFRTSVKCAIAVIVAIQWSLEIQRRGLDVCHVHAATVGAPSAAASVLAHMLHVTSSSTAHRNDIKVHAPARLMNSLTLNRAISNRAKTQLAERGISSEVVRFGGIGRATVSLDPATGSDLRCVTIGHLLPRKGQFRAIRMVAGARARGASVTLDIFGAGTLKDELQALIDELQLNEWVQLRGLLPHNSLVEEMFTDRWNTLVHTSVQIADDDEGIPVAVLEAAASGLAIIATDSGATGEFVNDDSNGLLLEPTNNEVSIEMGVEALLRLSSDTSLRNRLRAQALQDVAEYLAENSVRAVELEIQRRARH